MDAWFAVSKVPPLPAWWLNFIAWSSHLGPAGLLAFLGAFVVASLCCFPGWILRFGAGFAFGLARGAVVASAGSTLGAVAAFFIFRRWASGTVRRRFGRTDLFRSVDRAMRPNGAGVVFLLRLCPVIPASVLNYLLGLTVVGFGRYPGSKFPWNAARNPVLRLFRLGQSKRVGVRPPPWLANGPERPRCPRIDRRPCGRGRSLDIAAQTSFTLGDLLNRAVG